jgi:fatty acid desaturase
LEPSLDTQEENKNKPLPEAPEIAEEKKETKKITEDLKSMADYVRELQSELPKEIFKKEPMRLKYGVFFLVSMAAIVYSFMNFEMSWLVKLPLAIIMGMFTGGFTFLGHEILHGAIVKNRKAQDILGFFTFLPFMISPTYWRYWHNVLHHGNTQLLYKDPDAFPTRMVWKRSKFMQFVFPLSPGSGYFRSYFYFFYWFSFQAFLNQIYMRFGNKMWEKMNHKKVTVEFVLQMALIVGYMNFIGPENWIWLGVIPFMVMNYTVMSYISTNHNLSPYTKTNDPLVNSLDVTNHPLLELVHLNFGYHTEHHLYPSMPMSKAKIVHKKLKEKYPDRFQVMPKAKALKLLYSTPRIYKNREVLVHPDTGKEYKTLGT